MFITLTNSYPPKDGSPPKTYHINPNQITWVKEFEAIGDCPAHTEVFIAGSSNPFCVVETADQISELAREVKP